MNYWFEVISSFIEREGRYLICPINANYRVSDIKNYQPYRILMEPQKGDLVFHYLTNKVRGGEGAFTSFSWIEDGYYVVHDQDHLCELFPPYRKIDLFKNTKLIKPITMRVLHPYQRQLELIVKESGLSRTPFTKTFRMKQTYVGRIPRGFINIFAKLSETDELFNL